MEDVATVTLTSLMLFGSIRLFIKYGGLDLNKSTVVKAHITNAYETIEESGKAQARIFAFNLEGVGQTLGVRRKYSLSSDLIHILKKGDYVTVYYIADKSQFNTDVLQIEKAGEVIIDYETYVGTNTSMASLMVFRVGVSFQGR